MPEPKISREEAVKLFAKQNIVVHVVKTGKDGALRDPGTKRFVTEGKPLAAEHIVGLGERDGEVGITTVDGKKYAQAMK